MIRVKKGSIIPTMPSPNLIQKTKSTLTNPAPRSRTRWAFLVIILLALAAAIIDVPEAWNRTSDSLDAIVGRRVIPRMRGVPFRLGLDLLGGTHLLYEADVSAVPSGDRNEALEGVRDVIERRVNAFGVAEPVVQTTTTGDHYRVIVELAGIKDVNEAKKQIGETPVLEFKEETSEPSRLPTDEEKKQAAEINAAAEKKSRELLARALDPKTDFAVLAKDNSEDPGSKDKGGEVGYFRRGAMVKAFEDAAFGPALKVGGIYPRAVLSEFGYHIIKKTGEKTVDENGKKIPEVSASHILLRTIKPEDLVPREEWKSSGLGGKQLKRAIATFDQNTGEPQVNLEFNDEGKQLFADITTRNVEKLVAIFLDGSPISIPRVNEPIREGRAVISGRFTPQEARTLAQRLNAGALPLPISIVSEQTVGPTLGQASLKKTFIAGIIGFILVALFMIAYYRLAGVVAVVALAIYTAVLLALFKLIPVTLTLSGIAGFILSLGMAVDANVLIFERLKEELRAGRSIQSAIDEAFRRAWTSIRDGNLTTILAGVVMFMFASSVIKGFALTLTLGVLASMFSAITVSRVILRMTSGWIRSSQWLVGVPETKN